MLGLCPSFSLSYLGFGAWWRWCVRCTYCGDLSEYSAFMVIWALNHWQRRIIESFIWEIGWSTTGAKRVVIRGCGRTRGMAWIVDGVHCSGCQHIYASLLELCFLPLMGGFSQLTRHARCQWPIPRRVLACRRWHFQLLERARVVVGKEFLDVKVLW